MYYYFGNLDIADFLEKYLLGVDGGKRIAHSSIIEKRLWKI